MPFTPNFYERFTCDFCSAVQVVYIGDPQDMTIPDVEGVRCMYCGHVECVEDPDVLASKYGEDYRENPLVVKDGENVLEGI